VNRIARNRFDLDHIGAEVGQDHRGVRTRGVGTEIDDANAREGRSALRLLARARRPRGVVDEIDLERQANTAHAIRFPPDRSILSDLFVIPDVARFVDGLRGDSQRP
jgi:hypothetical protein